MNPAPLDTSTIAIGYDWLRRDMLVEGEFDKTVSENGIEVWVTQMGDYMNMNTAKKIYISELKKTYESLCCIFILLSKFPL